MSVKKKLDNRGHFVWAYIKTDDYWPGITVKHDEAGVRPPKQNRVYVFWFGDHRISEVGLKNVFDFKQHFKEIYERRRTKSSTSWRKGVSEAIKEIGSPQSGKWNEDVLIKWALEGFPSGNSSVLKTLPDAVSTKLTHIKKLNVNNSYSNETKSTPSLTVSNAIDVALSNETAGKFCLGCYTEEASEEHPLFDGQLCRICIDRVRSSIHTYGDDGISFFCAVCGFSGDMIVCSDINCGKSYCQCCIEHLASPGSKKYILSKKYWKCFFCEPQRFAGLIKIRLDWKNKIHTYINITNQPLVKMPEIPSQKEKLRVLSLFDGIATGFLVLDQLKISVETYFSCEIDEEAMRISGQHFGERITFVGKVEDLTEEKLLKLLPIDLLIAGSPCNDLSMANPKRKGLYDASGTGVLFFEFYRILCSLRTHNTKPYFWLFENVASMPIEWKAKISRFLQCEPSLFDAVTVSPQNRARYFWGNLPTLHQRLPDTEGPDLGEFLMSRRTATVRKLRTITTRSNSLLQGPDMTFPVLDEQNRGDKIWITEIERVFGLPPHYTDVGNVSVTKRQALIGKSWSVQVIACLFRFLGQYFRVRTEAENDRARKRRWFEF